MLAILLATAVVPACQDDVPVDLAALGDRALQELLRATSARDQRTSGDPLTFESCLHEMARRGGEPWVALLREELARARADVDVVSGREGPPHDLEVLTALRRAERKPDPLELAVEWEGTPVFEFPELPVFALRIVNRDEDGEAFGLTIGGDYRSGRLARWAVELEGAEGERVGRRVDWPWGVGGGLFTRGVLAPGRSLGWEPLRFADEQDEPRPLRLPMREYATPVGPGAYVARVLYHDQRDLTYVTDLRRLVLSRSAPLPFEWRAREVRLAAADVEELRAWIGDLLVERVFLISQPFGPDVGLFEGEMVAAEMLYNRGYASLPLLLESLLSGERTPDERARLLAMLYSLTGLLDPRGARGSLGVCRYTGRGMTGGGEMGGGTWRDAGPDPAVQAPLVECWRVLARMVELKVRD
jgi:hypothetical protein